MKAMMKTNLLSLLLPAVLLAGCGSGGTLKSDYYKKTEAGGRLESNYIGLGSYAVDSLELPHQKNSPWKFKAWYPSELKGGNGTYPVVVISNASNSPYSVYAPVLEHLASWGFVVIGNDDKQSARGDSAIASLEAITAADNSESSVFYKKLDLKKIGLHGASQGGVGAINAASNFSRSSMFASMFLASTPSQEVATNMKWSYDVSKIRIPSFMTSSTGAVDSGTIAPLASLKQNLTAMAPNLGGVIARRTKVDHTEVLQATDGYMTAWFAWTLKNDQQAGKVFTGPRPEIKHNPLWQDIEIKNF